MRPPPPPRFATPGLERVGYWLLAARAPTGIATAFNERRGALWVLLQARRTVPKPTEFEAEIEALRDLLVADQQPPGLPDEAGVEVERELTRSLRCLNAAEVAAAEAGLLR
jgi:hypothetical protein